MEGKGKEEKEKMKDEQNSFNKDTSCTKPSKRMPLSSWKLVLVLILFFAVYMMYVALQQYGVFSATNFITVGAVSKAPICHMPAVSHSDAPFFHFPKPVTYNRKECACTPVRFFAILSMQRSGSGWFETLLNSHPNISSNGEIFSVKPRRSNVTSITRTLNRLYNLDWYSSAAKNECTASIGLKWMLNQGLLQHHVEIADYFNQRGVSVIFLFRRNLLRRMVSILANAHDRAVKQLNGTHKAHVHSEAEAAVLAKFKPTINTTLLMSELRRADKMGREALKHFESTRHVLLYYEDLISNHTKLMDVLDFLQLPRKKLSSRHVKIHTKPLANQVENWGEVYRALNGTPFASFVKNDYRR
ncbi:hypothetical protein LUZ61_017543 [Rhynchospora tenuis]|uniref:Sulfotransferase n=1 Tax=Rhynchospora tenuis TaxID=198213 RepID=A0AAD5Z7R2_9POAL|nr:hypothetical protein LUZ61_017543 [Rhynchospora tenuis]